MKIALVIYLVTGILFVLVSIGKLAYLLSKDKGEEYLTSLVKAKKSLSDSISWKACAFIYAPISFAFAVITTLSCGVMYLFRKK